MTGTPCSSSATPGHPRPATLRDTLRGSAHITRSSSQSRSQSPWESPCKRKIAGPNPASGFRLPSTEGAVLGRAGASSAECTKASERVPPSTGGRKPPARFAPRGPAYGPLRSVASARRSSSGALRAAVRPPGAVSRRRGVAPGPASALTRAALCDPRARRDRSVVGTSWGEGQ